MTDHSLHRRIRALLAKGAGTDNLHEAEAFMAKARQLLVDNQLTMADVQELDSRDPLGFQGLQMPTRAEWAKLVAVAACDYFGCFCVFQQMEEFDGCLVYGREGARATTQVMLFHLWRSVIRACEELPVTEDRVGNALAIRLTRLAQQSPASSPVPGALVPVPEAEAAARAAHGETDNQIVEIGHPGLLAAVIAERISLDLQVDGGAPARAKEIEHG